VEPRHLSKAPITEALIDIHVDLPPGSELAALEEALEQQIGADYPNKKPILLATSTFEIAAGKIVPGTVEKHGCRFSDAAEKRIVQARMNGLSLSELAPYDRWERLRDETHRIWDYYRLALKPERIKRIAVRYINSIVFPLTVDFKVHFRTYPEVSTDLPQAVTSFLSRFTLEFPGNVTAIVSQTSNPVTAGSTTATMVLDIDVFRFGEFPPDSADVWAVLEHLRKIKNKIFFGSLTDEMLETYL
jgi:uncharacterized protein (TIGR04255 family)